MIIFD